MGLTTGDRIVFVEINDGVFALIAATLTVRHLKGMIRKPDNPVSIEDMNAAITEQHAKAAKKTTTHKPNNM